MAGYKATDECWQNLANPTCACSVELPQLFHSSSSSLFHQRFVPIVAAYIVLEAGAPADVQDEMKKLLSSPIGLSAAACLQRSTTIISERSTACSTDGATCGKYSLKFSHDSCFKMGTIYS